MENILREKHTRRDAQEAFQNAINQVKLVVNPNAYYYAGKYMYMYSDANYDYFKNINTRKYEVVVPYKEIIQGREVAC